ncbi:hypothetical protein BHE74_00019628 [Ensete ventricosum]|nr:hypothetical protein BHE74_00019628 [Ensete ventricosum]
MPLAPITFAAHSQRLLSNRDPRCSLIAECPFQPWKKSRVAAGAHHLRFPCCSSATAFFTCRSVTPSHCHRRCHAAATLFLYWKHVAASSGGSNPLLAGIYSSTSGGPLSSTPSYAPSLYTSPSTTEAEQMQLFSHLFFAVI